jgi:hypothetical protein
VPQKRAFPSYENQEVSRCPVSVRSLMNCIPTVNGPGVPPVPKLEGILVSLSFDALRSKGSRCPYWGLCTAMTSENIITPRIGRRDHERETPGHSILPQYHHAHGPDRAIVHVPLMVPPNPLLNPSVFRMTPAGPVQDLYAIALLQGLSVGECNLYDHK